MIYAGIGNRDIEKVIQNKCSAIAAELAMDGWLLRSGAAVGSDKAFMDGCDSVIGTKEIYTAKIDIPDWAFDLVWEFHPAPDRLSNHAERLMARNGMILFGADGKTPVDLVICYASSEFRGGTAYGLRLAKDRGIDYINLAKKDGWDRAKKLSPGFSRN